MHLETITAPTGDLVNLVDAKNNLRADHTEDDQEILDAIRAVQDHLEGHTGIVGRALMSQAHRLYLDAWPDEITLPLPPLVTVDAVKYLDTDGAEQTLAADQYLVSARNGVALIVPAYGVSWPGLRVIRDAVRVEFSCGYGSNNVPIAIVRAAKLLINHYFDNGGALNMTKEIASELPFGVASLLAPYRIQGL